GPVLEGPARASAHVCQAASCLSAGSDRVLDALTDRVEEAGLGECAVQRGACVGLCVAGPLVEIPQTGRLFEHVGEEALDGLVEALRDVTPDAAAAPRAPFFARQVRVATANHRPGGPEDLADSRAHHAY